jgi:tripartite-type tricarboxylate transporter receptor subunit TctC
LTRRKPPYDPLNDLEPVSHFTSFTYFLYAGDDVPASTLAELMDYVRENPGKVAYGAGDATSHMALTQIAMQGKLDLLYVPYKGVAQAFQDFAGGRIQLMVGTIDIHEQSKGKAKALAVLLPQRSPLRPDVPTFAEAGLPNLKLRPWTGWFAPAGTPKPVLDKLASTMDQVFKDPKLREMFAARGSVLEASTPDAMRAILIEQMPIWRETIQFAKIPIQD